MDILLLIIGDEIDVHAYEIEVLRTTRRRLRDAQDPFEIPENYFRQLYRFSKDAIRSIIDELRPFMPVVRRSTCIPHELQVLATINFMASGSYQRRVGQDFLTCMSQTTISTYLHSTVNALNEIMENWICFPVTDAKLQQTKEEFFRNTGFPGVIGAIDGTHIAIFPPQHEREYLFINRKLYHSLNVQIICNYHGEITSVNAAHGGRTHDARVFRSSRVCGHLQNRHREDRRNSWLLGDSAYPLLPYLLTPKLHEPPGTPGARYTENHIRTRVVVEKCFGVMKGRWRCLRKEKALHYQPEFAALIVNACCVLHNIALRWRLPEDEIHLDEMDLVPAIPNEGDNVDSGEYVRNEVIRWYFTNP